MTAPSPRAAFQLWSEGEKRQREGAYRCAADRARQALVIIEPLLPNEGGKGGELILLRALELLGFALRGQGLYTEAEPPHVRAIEAAEALSPPRPDLVATAWNSLGVLCKFAGWFDRGAEAYAKALELAVGEPLLTATILHNIGGLDHARGRFESAIEPVRRAWEIRREHCGDEHPETLEDANACAAVLDCLRRYKESRPIYQKSLAIYGKLFGPEHYEIAATLHNMALVEHAEGRAGKAIEYARRSYAIKRKLLGPRHLDTALSAMNLGFLLLEGPESRDLLTQALQAMEATLDPNHPHIASCRRLLLRASYRTGRP